MNGWIKLHRSLLDDAIWKCSTDSQKIVLITIMLKANHESSEWIWKGSKYTCKPGQFITSISGLANDAGVSKQSLRGAIAKLKSLGFLTTESNTQSTLITICNYSKYQKNEDTDNTRANKQPTHDQHTTNTRPTTNKNDKNNKNDKKKRETPLPDDFKITDSMREWALNKNFTIDIYMATEKWKNAMLSKGRTYIDWTAAWRTGMLKAEEWTTKDSTPKEKIVPIRQGSSVRAMYKKLN
jgi:hypothetical protein